MKYGESAFDILYLLLGMLMLPKTVCYILMICTFYSAAAKGETDL